ncbi:Putative lincomycin resistance protein [Corynebacterium glyciniphilum AJ 3170]|uniref:Putative lincomycin resistance protein n=1 Tax=Corynebacterium glyciniphilum AJ 3170 TaxID=1404245 RepID=X5DYC5_9CORY|nr:MDR family MFS transporter [Corynebacterium glyciniphilum]AHW65612.1 Putative lincomycin resistance protein [Corynebacterium glyciniphilum AJ 3170]
MADTRTTSGSRPDTTGVNVGLLIGILVAAAFVAILNETALSNALPSLMREFEVGEDVAQWLTTVFMLTMAVVIPTTGYLMQRLTLRTIYIVALSLFLAGTVLAAVAPVFAALLAGRVLQAAGTALIMPLLMTTIMILIPVERRGSVFGLVTIVIAVGPALGPTFAGLVLELASWRWIFLVMVPLALLALVMGIWQIRNFEEPSRPPFDPVSVLLSAVGFAAAIYGLSGLSKAAEGFPTTAVVCLVIGAVVLVIFFRRQGTLMRAQAAGDHRAPLMNTTPLKIREFSWSLGLMLLSFGSLFGFIIIMPIFGQNVLGLSELQTGLVTLPGGIIMGAMGPIVGRLYDAHGTRPLIIPGGALLVVAMGLLLMLDENKTFWYLAAIAVVLNIGLSLLMTPLMSNALAAVPNEISSHGSAILNTLQQLAGAAGTALFIAVMGIGSANSTAGTPTGALVDGVHVAFFLGAGIAVLVFVLTLVLRIDARDMAATADEDQRDEQNA